MRLAIGPAVLGAGILFAIGYVSGPVSVVAFLAGLGLGALA